MCSRVVPNKDRGASVLWSLMLVAELLIRGGAKSAAEEVELICNNQSFM